MIETGILGLVVLVFAIKSIKNFVINAAVGLIILFLANTFAGLGIGYSLLVVLICAIGGALGAIMIILLHFLEIAF
jgi:hypothetical protein